MAPGRTLRSSPNRCSGGSTSEQKMLVTAVSSAASRAIGGLKPNGVLKPCCLNGTSGSRLSS